MKNKLVQRFVVGGGLALFAGLSILNMQTYLALAKEAYKLVKFLPFAWWITPQILPATLAAVAVSAFFLVRGRKLNPFFVAVLAIAVGVLFILAMSSEDMAVSSFGLLLWATSTAMQTAPFWVKTFFFDAIRDAFRNQPTETTAASDSKAVRDLTEKRNNLPQEILQGFTSFAFGANAVDIGLGIWQYPIVSWANLTAMTFTAETIAVDSVLKVILLSVLPEVLLFGLSHVLYLCSLGGATANRTDKASKRRPFGGGDRPRQTQAETESEVEQGDARRHNPYDRPQTRAQRRKGKGFSF